MIEIVARMEATCLIKFWFLKIQSVNHLWLILLNQCRKIVEESLSNTPSPPLFTAWVFRVDFRRIQHKGGWSLSVLVVLSPFIQ
jgi:hypothetical protein